MRHARLVGASGVFALALAACGGGARSAPVKATGASSSSSETVAGPAVEPVATEDAAVATCRAQAASLTTSLQQILALSGRWYAVREQGAALAVDEAAAASLRAAGPRALELHVELTFHVLGGSSTDPVEVAERAAAIVAAQPMPVVVVPAPDARWADVASLTVALQRAGVDEVGFGFAVGSARLGTSRLRQRLAETTATAFEVMNALGADVTRRCPKLGALFVAGDDVEILTRLAAEAAPTLVACACSVEPTELAEIVDVLLVPDWYLGERRVVLDPAGGRLTAPHGSRFDQVAPRLLALPDGARVWPGR